jgi:hypothetical protein
VDRRARAADDASPAALYLIRVWSGPDLALIRASRRAEPV